MPINKYHYVSMLFLWTLPIVISGQDTIRLLNPSFEDIPQISKAPESWSDCGFYNESPPDIHPNADLEQPFLGITTQAHHGSTYICMVTRDNETWEKIGQKLSAPLKANRRYHFSIYLATSDQLKSVSKKNIRKYIGLEEPPKVKFEKPTTLRIRGGSSICDKDILLATSDPIRHTDWQQYDFILQAKEDIEFIMLEAFYKLPAIMAGNGNILIDHCSDIIEIQE